MKSQITLLALAMIIFFTVPVSGWDPCVVGRVEADPEYEPGVLRAHVPFRINVYLEQITGSDLPGFYFVPRFYGDNGVSEVTQVEATGYRQCCTNVTVNPLMDSYFNLFSTCTCADWDAALPDTFAYSGAGTFGWPAGTGEELVLSFEFIVDQEGTFCVDTAYLEPFGDQIWECFTQIDVPYCWEVIDVPAVCGDVDGSNGINILDITYIISYLYKGGPAPTIMAAADVNSSGGINVLDITVLIGYLYKSGPPPNCP